MGDHPTLPPRMSGRPFGVDSSGRALNRSRGTLIRSTVECFVRIVDQKAREATPPGGDVNAAAKAAVADATSRLVQRLNDAIGDPAYHVTYEYLMNEGNSYSVEFNIYLAEMCRAFSGDPQFHFRAGSTGMPALSRLARPLGPRQV